MRSLSTLVFTIIIFFSCKKDETVTGLETRIETQIFFSIEPNKAETIVEVFNISAALAEVGVVLAEKAEPTVADRVISINNVTKNQSLRLVIDNLVKGKTYYLRSFFKNADKKVTYGNSLNITQNFDNRWSKVESPEVSGEEYILTENVFGNSGFGGIEFTVVDPIYNRGTNTYFFPNFQQWDPRFLNINKTPFQVRFNEINAAFTSGGERLFLKGGGYQKLDNGDRFYLKDLAIIQGSYRFSPQYPGANQEVTSIGIGKYCYIIENVAAGKIWLFDYENLKWTNYDSVPFDFDAKYYSYVANGKIYLLVEPKDLKADLSGFFEYQPENKKWIKMADFKGQNRRRSSGFVFSSKIYFGAGQASSSGSGLRDFWEYDPKTNVWQEAFTYPGGGTVNLATVSYEGFVFAGFGQSVITNASKGEKFKNMNDFWTLRLK
jgi:hypothetical protein